MFKFLLIVGLAVYILYKIGSFFFKIGAASQQLRNQQQGFNPQPPSSKNKKQDNFKGGEYIDYEEVK